MKTALITVIAAASSVPGFVLAKPCFGYIPDWESADKRATIEIALADFNGDGWQVTNGERKTGDGERHLFYINHFPALTITAVRVNGTRVPRADYCFDSRAGWFSLKDAPANGARVDVDYKWSNRLDLFAGNEERSKTDARDAVYYNNGNAFNKSPSWLSTIQKDVNAVKEGDVDGDGDVDVAIAGYDYVDIYYNNGAGLEGTPSWHVTLNGGYPGGLAWGDLNSDGYPELAVADNNRFCVFTNNGGALESTPSWSVMYEDSVAVAWGDMDGDGDMDLAGGTVGDNGYAYVFRNAGGVLESTYCWRNDQPSTRSIALAWGDVNGDGEMDLAKGFVSIQPPCDIEIFFSHNGVLPTSPSWTSEYFSHPFYSYLADCDGDKRMDLIYSMTAGLGCYFHRGGGLEKTPSWVYKNGPPYFTLDLRVGDVNGDGFLDVAAGCTAQTYPMNAEGGPNKLFLNKGNIGITVKGFAASACERGVALRWEVDEEAAGFNLFRETKDAAMTSEPGKINAELITGRSPYRYLDSTVETGKAYRYWLEVAPLAGPAERHGPVECTAGRKASFALAQNAPNPARATTTFAFSVPTACDATLTVYDIAGRKVAVPFAGAAVAGENEVSVDVSALAPGVYTYRLEAGGEAAAKRMVVVR
jgi:hypothetical protein